MRAAVFHGRGDLRIEDVPKPEPGDGELLLQVEAAGICGTDAHEYSSGPHMYPVEVVHPVTGHHGPFIPGHELSGTVVAAGPNVGDFGVGDLVASGAGVSCGRCHWCRRGRTNLCQTYHSVGLERPGGLAQFAVVPATTAVATEPYGLSPDAAALGQPMAIAVHAMRRGRLESNDVAVVIGAGGIGAFLTYAACDEGATVVVADLDEQRLAVASGLGAHHVADPAVTPLHEVLEAESLIPTVIYEVSGSEAGLRAALSVAPPGCRIVLVGLQGAKRELDLRPFSLREFELIGTNAHVVATDLPEALRLLASRPTGWRDIAPVALPLSQLAAEGLEPLVEGRSSRIKTLLDPWAASVRDTRM